LCLYEGFRVANHRRTDDAENHSDIVADRRIECSIALVAKTARFP